MCHHHELNDHGTRGRLFLVGLVLLLSLPARPTHAYSMASPRPTASPRPLACGRGHHRPLILPHVRGPRDLPSLTARPAKAEWASDENRGENHLSAFLDEGDVVLYKTGRWLVDGVEVVSPTGEAEGHRLCEITAIQLVWTHNCEHGMLQGIPLALAEDKGGAAEGGATEGGASASGGGDGPHLYLIESPESDGRGVQLGPEQLVARVGSISELGEGSGGGGIDEGVLRLLGDG